MAELSVTPGVGVVGILVEVVSEAKWKGRKRGGGGIAV
jgi:hypothetical protein